MEPSATATRGRDSINYQSRGREGSPSPNTGFEVIAPGRQGFRARREDNPACGSANLHWDLPPRYFMFLPVVLRRSRVNRSLLLRALAAGLVQQGLHVGPQPLPGRALRQWQPG